GIAANWSIRRIAQGLGRAPSTISREIRRNGGIQGYRANQADRRTWGRALRPKPCRLALHRELRWRVAQKLALQWSPEQISGWLKQEFPTDQDMQISHEAIYRSLFIQTRGVLKKELVAHLRTARRMRRPSTGSQLTAFSASQIYIPINVPEFGTEWRTFHANTAFSAQEPNHEIGEPGIPRWRKRSEFS